MKDQARADQGVQPTKTGPAPVTQDFDSADSEVERIVEQQEGIVAAKGPVENSDRPAPNVPHPEDLNMMDNAKTKGR